MHYKVSKADKRIVGTIKLEGSKSISNRVLIIRALCGQNFDIQNLSKAKDTETLVKLLGSQAPELNAGPAGTTFRFLTAYLALQEGTQILTGSERMKQRPIGILVEALKTLGADIEYLDKEGFPPLKIHAPKNLGQINEVKISANVSSQFISALLLVAPALPKGLKLTLEGRVVSRPYIQMTLSIMKYFGVRATWEGQTISVPAKTYQAKPFKVEADWSAASYYYEIAAFADVVDLELLGLFGDSLQGDSALMDIMESFGIQTTITSNGIQLSKSERTDNMFEQDFVTCPDLAQAIAVACAGVGWFGVLRGLETLYIKETDRVAALANELAKVGVTFKKMPDSSQRHPFDHAHSSMGKAARMSNIIPFFNTYHDHRMAMCLAPLALLLGEVVIEDPLVVGKSYPSFWEDLGKLGFVIEEITN